MKYYLIHGYGKALDLRDKIIPENMGFHIFDAELKNGQAAVFDWAKRVKRGLFSALNPFSQLKLYHEERAKVEENELQKRLVLDLEEKQPEIIICHSLGCRLLLNTFKNFGKVLSLKKVIFVSADLPCKINIEIYDMDFININCWWDNALLGSVLLNWYLPLGLVGGKAKNIKNIFWPLRKGPNLHQDIWRDAEFKKKILEVLSK